MLLAAVFTTRCCLKEQKSLKRQQVKFNSRPRPYVILPLVVKQISNNIKKKSTTLCPTSERFSERCRRS